MVTLAVASSLFGCKSVLPRLVMCALFAIVPACDGAATRIEITCSPGPSCSAEQVTTPFDALQFHPVALADTNVVEGGRVSATTRPMALSLARSSATTSNVNCCPCATNAG